MSGRSRPASLADRRTRAAQVCKPKDFATQINLNMDNCWGIVRALVDLALRMDDGKYLIVKDPNKPLLRLYRRGACSLVLDASHGFPVHPQATSQSESSRQVSHQEDIRPSAQNCSPHAICIHHRLRAASPCLH